MKQSNLKIAITGGIGSGKSSVADIIAGEGFPVFSCDQIYSELVQNKNFLNTLCERFGDILSDDGSLDRQKLSAIVFCDRQKLKELNELTHKKIMKEAISKMEGYGISFLEVPLLFEGGFENLFDKVIVVLRPFDDRIKSVMQRDNISQKNAILRVNNQLNYDKCDFSEYYVIHNCANLDDLRQKTLDVLAKIQLNN